MAQYDLTENIEISCFKAYDVRGRLPDQLNDEIAYRIGRAYARVIAVKQVVVGYDIRLDSERLCEQLIEGLLDEGVEVINIGCCGTEEVYFATFHLGVDGGVMVTASHNPKDYNGMKFVREQSKPIHAENGLLDIRAEAQKPQPAAVKARGSVSQKDTRADFVQHLLSYVDVSQLKPLTIVANPGNGGAGLVMDALMSHLPLNMHMMHEQPDGNFPNGVPNPLLIENREATSKAVLAHAADMGIAWDGDFDRCFFFDEKGGFIEGYYLVGLFSEFFLQQTNPQAVVHDPRLYWNTQAIAKKFDSQAIQSKTGHAYMKGVMREHDAVYGGEMSAHHYFRDFAYCDSGMIPWLLMAAILSNKNVTLSSLVKECMQQFPVSGEINSRLKSADEAIAAVEAHFFKENPLRVDKTDGVSMDFTDWRFNLRKSNTEPVVRLNIEAREDISLMERQRDFILAMLKQY